MNIYIVSDYHLFHEGMAEYCGRPPAQEVIDMIIKRHNSIVKEEDLTINLGDVTIGGKKEQIKEIVTQLNGKHVLVRGNHDYSHSNTWFTDCGFSFVCDFLCISNILLSHWPMDIQGDRIAANVHGHFHNNPKARWEKSLVDKITDRHYLLCLEYVKYTPLKLLNILRSKSKHSVVKTKDVSEIGLWTGLLKPNGERT